MVKYIAKKWTTIIPAAFFTAGLMFFSFFYYYHFHFIEQLQIFQYTNLYFSTYLNEPGFLSAIAGDFLTQFYKIHLLAGVIIILILALIYYLLKTILSKFGVTSRWIILPLLPIAFLFLLHCSINYRLSATFGILLALSLVNLWFLIKKFRIVAGILIIVISYFALGTFAFIPASLFVIFEIANGKGLKPFIYSFIYFFVLILLPVIARNYFYIISWKQALLPIANYDWRYEIPVLIYILFASIPLVIITGIILLKRRQKQKKKTDKLLIPILGQIIVLFAVIYYFIPEFVSSEIERGCRLDYEVRNKNWDKIIEIADSWDSIQPVHQPYINLALSHNGELLTSLFDFAPRNVNALVPPKSENMLFNMICMEVYYRLAWTSLAQVHGIMANQETFRGRNVRCMQRLTEMEIINGNYILAEKYLDILDKTLFYKSWSKEKRKLLWNEELIKKEDDYRETRKQLPKKDMLNGANLIVDLKQYLNVNRNCKVASEYLVAALMLNKDNKAIVDYLESLKEIKYVEYPLLIQQVGMMYFVYKKGDQEVLKKFTVSDPVFRQFKDFYTIMDMSRSNIQMAQGQLQSKYAKTYWYYLYFNK